MCLRPAMTCASVSRRPWVTCVAWIGNVNKLLESDGCLEGRAFVGEDGLVTGDVLLKDGSWPWSLPVSSASWSPLHHYIFLP